MKSEKEVRKEMEAWREYRQEMREGGDIEAAGKAGLAAGVLEWVLD